MILRNSLLSFLSLALPLLVGLFTVPPIIAALGTERFGALTLAWAITGYAGVFDLGIGRGLTRRVAELGERLPKIRAVVRLGMTLLLVLGLVLGLLVAAAAPLIDHRSLGLDADEYRTSILLLAASVPLVILGGGLRGALEGRHRFALVALVRLGFGLLTFGAPMLVISAAPRLDTILAIMLIGRLMGCLVMAWGCRGYLAKGESSLRRRRAEGRRMLRFGGWVTASNLISALMLYSDRFLIAASVHASALAFYTTPYEFVTRLFIVPSALSSVLFPHMSRHARLRDGRCQLLALGCGVVLLSVTPVIAALMLFAEPILAVWIDPGFAAEAAPVLRILAGGVLLNCLAQILQTSILGHGLAAWMARLHLLECLVYLPALYLALQRFGIEGAAWVWTLRVAADSLAMAWRIGALQPQMRAHWWALGSASLVLAGLGVGSELALFEKALVWVSATCFAMAVGGWLAMRSRRLPTAELAPG